MQRDRANVFAGNEFNRLSERREDAAWLAAAYRHERALILPVWQGHNWLGTQPPVIGAHPSVFANAETLFPDSIFLGEFAQRWCFAVEISGSVMQAEAGDGAFIDLRRVGGELPGAEAGVLAYARAMITWQHNHRFCGACGAPTAPSRGGHVMRCSAASCGRTHFPRLDPTVIVLVTDGRRALLGRNAAWTGPRYSTIAGFMEWGESVEEAVRREVYEETGVEVGRVSYHSSQPWPFPSSLMLGFIAEANTTAIQLRDGELAEARWFTRDELVQGQIRLPPRHALSYQLLATWYDQETGRSLDHDAPPATS